MTIIFAVFTGIISAFSAVKNTHARPAGSSGAGLHPSSGGDLIRVIRGKMSFVNNSILKLTTLLKTN